MGKLTISTGPCSKANCNKLPESKSPWGTIVHAKNLRFIKEKLELEPEREVVKGGGCLVDVGRFKSHWGQHG